MGYIEEILLPDEEITVRAKTHWIVLIYPVIPFLIGVVLGLLTSISAISSSNTNVLILDNVIINFVCCASPAWLLAILTASRAGTSYYTTEFAVTNKRVIAKTGIIQHRSLEILLDRVESISVDQGLLGSLLDYGTIIVHGSGGTHQSFPNIDDPLNLSKQINKILPDMQTK